MKPLSLVSLGLAALAWTAGCGGTAPPKDAPLADAAASAPTAAASAPIASATATASASAAPEPAPTASASASANGPAAPPAPEKPDNKVEPMEGPDLQDRAKALFEAIAKDDPALGDSFWFPREPFKPLKDIADPDKYWQQLHKAYAKDIHKLHKKRDKWDGATFLRFEGWSAPKWVKPGEEANKIGYYRAFRGNIHYSQGGSESTIEVRVMITWQGRWFVTHLAKFK